MIYTEAALFLSTRSEVLGRFEGWYDQRLTQRLVLQPRVELNLSAQNIPQTRIGAGLSDAELGLRLRYEIARTVRSLCRRLLRGEDRPHRRRRPCGRQGRHDDEPRSRCALLVLMADASCASAAIVAATGGGSRGCKHVRGKIGAPGAIRTPGPQIRSLMLYPAELRVHWSGADRSGFAGVQVPLRDKHAPHTALRDGPVPPPARAARGDPDACRLLAAFGGRLPARSRRGRSRRPASRTRWPSPFLPRRRIRRSTR